MAKLTKIADSPLTSIPQNEGIANTELQETWDKFLTTLNEYDGEGAILDTVYMIGSFSDGQRLITPLVKDSTGENVKTEQEFVNRIKDVLGDILDLVDDSATVKEYELELDDTLKKAIEDSYSTSTPQIIVLDYKSSGGTDPDDDDNNGGSK